MQSVVLAVSSTSKNRGFMRIPLTEDPASEGSAALGPGRFFQRCKACKAMSLTGFTYLISNTNQIKHLQNEASSVMNC